jgi:hypothetical protein
VCDIAEPTVVELGVGIETVPLHLGHGLECASNGSNEQVSNLFVIVVRTADLNVIVGI